MSDFEKTIKVIRIKEKELVNLKNLKSLYLCDLENMVDFSVLNELSNLIELNIEDGAEIKSLNFIKNKNYH